ncbi:hypothetical protein BDR07DRAFT_1490060 [Suillus spraguei]|nr:hypothetical protein BDR07DRAFT_1490060 [Suillus spraguei]
MATRLLRTNILAPLTGKYLCCIEANKLIPYTSPIAQSALDARLDSVEELIHSEDIFTEIKDALKVLDKMDFDKLISSHVEYDVRQHRPTNPSQRFRKGKHIPASNGPSHCDGNGRLFVPAEHANFRLPDALLTRLSNDDDIKKSLGTFANEMTSSVMILGFGV